MRLAKEAPPTTIPTNDLRRMLTQAMQQSYRTQVTFEVPGHSLPQSHCVIPVAIDRQWVQVYDMDEQRYILIDWKQILSVEII